MPSSEPKSYSGFPASSQAPVTWAVALRDSYVPDTVANININPCPHKTDLLMRGDISFKKSEVE